MAEPFSGLAQSILASQDPNQFSRSLIGGFERGYNLVNDIQKQKIELGLLQLQNLTAATQAISNAYKTDPALGAELANLYAKPLSLLGVTRQPVSPEIGQGIYRQAEIGRLPEGAIEVLPNEIPAGVTEIPVPASRLGGETGETVIAGVKHIGEKTYIIPRGKLPVPDQPFALTDRGFITRRGEVREIPEEFRNVPRPEKIPVTPQAKPSKLEQMQTELSFYSDEGLKNVIIQGTYRPADEAMGQSEYRVNPVDADRAEIAKAILKMRQGAATKEPPPPPKPEALTGSIPIVGARPLPKSFRGTGQPTQPTGYLLPGQQALYSAAAEPYDVLRTGERIAAKRTEPQEIGTNYPSVDMVLQGIQKRDIIPGDTVFIRGQKFAVQQSEDGAITLMPIQEAAAASAKPAAPQAGAGTLSTGKPFTVVPE